jgi:hypothetical protein
MYSYKTLRMNIEDGNLMFEWPRTGYIRGAEQLDVWPRNWPEPPDQFLGQSLGQDIGLNPKRSSLCKYEQENGRLCAQLYA